MNKSNERIPQWVLDELGFKTRREFKQHFRKKLRDLDKAALEFLSYSAYIPTVAWYKTLDISANVNDIAILLSQKEWGR